MFDSINDHFIEVESIAEVVMNVRKMVVDGKRFFVVGYRLIRFSRVVVCISKANESLKLILVKLKSLYVVSDRLFRIP